MKLLTGLFISQKKKQSFIKNIEGDKYVLDASPSKVYRKVFFWLKRYSNTDYFPQYCFMVDIRRVLPLLIKPKFWKTNTNTTLLRKAYRVETLIFKYRVDPYKGKKVAKYSYTLFAVAFYSAAILKKLCLKLNFFSKNTKESDSRIYTGDDQVRSPVQKTWFKLRFLLGYKYCQLLFTELLSQKEFTEILHWGPRWTTAEILSTLAEKQNIPFYNVEYGEMDNSFSINEIGMFGDSDLYRNFTEVIEKPISTQEREAAKQIIESYRERYAGKINVNLLCDKSWHKSQAVIENIQAIKNEFSGIVYISGVELLYSGWSVSSDGRFLGNPNQIILEKVCAALKDKNYLILYRDHPIAIRQTPSLLGATSGLPNVIDCSSMPFSYILRIADYVVSAPSKVQFESLMIDKKVISFGECIAPPQIAVSNFQQVSDASTCSLEEIEEAFERLANDNKESTLSTIDYVAYLNRSLITP
ncbi:hypothetical protein [Neptuniibacter sp.]|uniref:hypothetical protein n=1 Tax=Neptuniibacter sp. TaxID=1962643 RepID=UPI003B5C5F03